MAITFDEDTLRILEAHERGGVTVSAIKGAIVRSDNATDWPTDSGALIRILDTSKNSLPKPGDAMSALEPGLVCVERVVRMLQPTQAEVRFIYEYVNTAWNNFRLWTISASLKSVTSSEFPAGGASVVVQHNDQGYQEPVTALEPDSVLSFNYLVSGVGNITAANHSSQWHGAVNSVGWTWGGGGTREWMCTGLSHRLLTQPSQTQKYIYEFQFRHSYRPWTPIAKWKDSTTGKAPTNTGVAGNPDLTGFYRALDFNSPPS